MRSCVKIVVERQLSCIRRADLWCFTQPQSVLDVADLHDGVPAVGGLAQFAGCKIDRGEPDRGIGVGCLYLSYRNDRRQRLRRPEDRLLVKTPVWVMSESRRTAPS